MAFMKLKLQCSTIPGQRALSASISRNSAIERIWPGRSALSALKRNSLTLGRSRAAYQVKTLSHSD
jgi:hypothetical protein